MLVLERQLGQRVMIGPDVSVQVVRVRGGKVRLAFTAPPEVRIDREEVRAAMTGTATAGDLSLCRAICDAERTA